MMVAGGLVPNRHQWIVSLTFREIFKIFSLSLCIAEIILLMRIPSWNFCTCAQSMAFGTCTKFQLEILTINGIVYFRKIILESSRNVSETTSGHQQPPCCLASDYSIIWVYYVTFISHYDHFTNYVKKMRGWGKFAGSFVIGVLVL